MKNPMISRGVCNFAWEAYVLASQRANIDIKTRSDGRISQAIGNAAASKGYHAKDGVLDGHAYTAAIDLSIRGLNKTQIATWIEELCGVGFANFFRNGEKWEGNEHIHGNYAGVPQKSALRMQNLDFFAGKDGLVSHSRIDQEYWYPEIERRRIPEQMFKLSNGDNPTAVRSLAFDLMDAAKPEVRETYAFFLGVEQNPRFWMPVYDGVSYAPVRAFGSALGLDVRYIPESKSIVFAIDDAPVALKIIAGVGYSPVRQLVNEVGLKIKVDAAKRTVTVTR